MRHVLVAMLVGANAGLGDVYAGNVSVDENTVYYNVTGSSAAEIFADIQRRRPGFLKGRHDAAGLTEWRYGYSIRVQTDSSGCAALSP